MIHPLRIAVAAFVKMRTLVLFAPSVLLVGMFFAAGCSDSTPGLEQDVGQETSDPGELPETGVPQRCERDADCIAPSSCLAASCDAEDGRCIYEPVDARCDDGLYCNGEERCAPEEVGADGDGCLAGTPPMLSDGVSCTVDSCNEETNGSNHVPDDGRCTDDGNDCTIERCNATTGCEREPAPEGATCDFGAGLCDGAGACLDCIDDAEPGEVDRGCSPGAPACVSGACVQCVSDVDCFEGLSCDSGLCVGCRGDSDCDDGVTCTVDTCDLDSSICSNTPSSERCDDGDLCTGIDQCLPESELASEQGCVAINPIDPDDGIDCTVDSCDPTTGVVNHVPDDTACADPGVCEVGICDPDAGCESEALAAGLACPGGVCDGAGSCAVCADTSAGGIDAGCNEATPSCDSGVCVACTEESEACPLDCAGVPGGDATEDACGVCDNDPTNNCIGGCDGPCIACGSDSDCDDDNACTEGSCDAETGLCVWDRDAREGDSCDDGDACTSASRCSMGTCVGTEITICEVGGCFTGRCDSETGCEFSEEGTSCEDDNDATNAGYCDGRGTCIGACEPSGVCSVVETYYGPDGRISLCYERATTGRFCNATGAFCDTGYCNNVGVCEPADIPNCRECSVDADCNSPCLTGTCNTDLRRCDTVPSGQSCDDGLETTTNDVCSREGLCQGTPPAVECGTWLTDGEGEYTFFFPRSTDCPDDGDPCTQALCTSAGTCTVQALDEGAPCSLNCGPGSCSAAGVCELQRDDCQVEQSACWQSVCDTATDTCTRLSADPFCEEASAVCAEGTSVCTDEDENYCGDGFCSEVEDSAICPADCVASLCNESDCTLTYRDLLQAGTWRSAQSTAYGFPIGDAHQTQSLTRMLDDGVRTLHFLVDYCTPGDDSGPLCICNDNNSCGFASTLLEPRFEEVADWLSMNDEAIVTLIVEDFVSDRDLRRAVDNAGLSPYLYRQSASAAYYDPWLLNLSTMVRKNRRLVIFGGGYLPSQNLFLATERWDVPGPEQNNPFLINLADRIYNCANRFEQTPDDLPGFAGIYAARHGGTPLTNTWAGAACYNNRGVVNGHVSQCETFAPVQIMLFDFYNSARGPLALVRSDVPYEDRCADTVDGCLTDSDCESGSCGGLFICLDCTEDDDCEDTEHCDRYFGVCRSDLQDGALCDRDDVCRSGVCDILCTSCDTDADCDEETEWCDAFGGCQQKKARGFGCLNAQECISDVCFGGFCTECATQADCEAGTYCNLDILPGESRCVDERANGEGCTNNFECTTGNCHAATCSECDAQSDCPGDEYCTLDLVPPIESTCEARKPQGQGCGSNVECLSGRCVGFVCEDPCSTNSECGANRYCDGGGICRDQGEIGEGCLSDIECQSGDCYLGFCVDCNAQSDCSGAQFCSLDPAPGASRCIDRKNNGSICVNNFECASGNCHATVCSECDEQSDCSSGEFCTLDVIPPINSTCEPLKDNGSSCGSAIECASNACTAFVCGECASDSDCSANEHCDAFNNCVADVGNNSPCLRNSVCQSGICSAGFCAECLSDANCPTNEHCDAGGDCVADVAENAVCTRDSVCQTNICLEGFCAGCRGDGDCPSSQHCDAGNSCAADVGNNSPCLRDSFCTTGICSLGFCAECLSDNDCPSWQHCDVGATCANDVGNNAPCLRNAVCNTGICSAGFCTECLGHGDCASNEFCDAGGDCLPKVPDGTACGSPVVCLSGCCNFLFTCGGLGC